MTHQLNMTLVHTTFKNKFQKNLSQHFEIRWFLGKNPFPASLKKCEVVAKQHVFQHGNHHGMLSCAVPFRWGMCSSFWHKSMSSFGCLLVQWACEFVFLSKRNIFMFHKLVIRCGMCFYGRSSQIFDELTSSCFKQKREICFRKKYNCYLVKLYSLRDKTEKINRVTKESYVFGILAITDFQGNLKYNLDYLMAWKTF